VQGTPEKVCARGGNFFIADLWFPGGWLALRSGFDRRDIDVCAGGLRVRCELPEGLALVVGSLKVSQAACWFRCALDKDLQRTGEGVRMNENNDRNVFSRLLCTVAKPGTKRIEASEASETGSVDGDENFTTSSQQSLSRNAEEAEEEDEGQFEIRGENEEEGGGLKTIREEEEHKVDQEIKTAPRPRSSTSRTRSLVRSIRRVTSLSRGQKKNEKIRTSSRSSSLRHPTLVEAPMETEEKTSEQDGVDEIDEDEAEAEDSDAGEMSDDASLHVEKYKDEIYATVTFPFLHRSSTSGAQYLDLKDEFMKKYLFSRRTFWDSLKRSELAGINLRDIELTPSHMTPLEEAIEQNSGSLESLSFHNVDTKGRMPLSSLIETLAGQGDEHSRLEEITLDNSARSDTGQLHAFVGSFTQEETLRVVEYHYWSTLDAKDVGLTEGTWYYEVRLDRLLMNEFVQIGWADAAFRCASFIDGVGDDDHSWAFDGMRKCVWHAGNDRPWGKKSDTQDVICCLLNLDNRQILFGLNGSFNAPMGVAFENVPEGAALRPAITAGRGARLNINFGDRPFVHPPPHGAKPVMDWAEAWKQEGTKVLSRGLAKLSHMAPRLQSIDLSNNALGNDFTVQLLEALMDGESCMVRSLKLTGNKLTNAIGPTFAALVGKGHLLSLDLSDNNMSKSPDGALGFCTELLEVVQNGSSNLGTLNLDRNSFDRESGNDFAALFGEEMAGEITHFSFAGNELTAQAFVSLIAPSSGLQIVNVEGCNIILEKGDLGRAFQRQRTNDNLESLNAASCGLSPQVFSAVLGKLRCSKLKRLNLAQNKLTDDSIKEICGLLKRNQTLERAVLETNLLSSNGISVIAKEMKRSKLRSLSVRDNWTDEGLSGSELRHFKRLHELSVGNPYFSFPQGDAVALQQTALSLKRLRALDLSGTKFSSKAQVGVLLGELLAKSTSLRKVNFAEMALGDAGICNLLQGLQEESSLCNLDMLDISKNATTYLGAKEITSFVLTVQGKVTGMRLRGNSASKSAERLLERVVTFPAQHRAEFLFNLLFETPTENIPNFLDYMHQDIENRMYVWNELCMNVAQNDFAVLEVILAAISKKKPDMQLWTVVGGLHFHNCRHPIILPENFRTLRGELCFDECQDTISLPNDLRVHGFLNFMKCEGVISIGDGLHVEKDITFEHLPRLNQLPPRMYVGKSMMLLDCAALEGLPRDIDFGDERIVVIHYCPNITLVPDSVVQKRGRLFLAHTGVSDEAISRLEMISNPEMTVRNQTSSNGYLDPKFPSLKLAVEFWVNIVKGSVTEGKEDEAVTRENLAEELKACIPKFYEKSVLLFLSKLRMAKENQSSSLRVGLARRVLEALCAIVEEKEARENLLIRISDSIDACGDKPVQALNQMKAVIDTCRARGNREKLRELGLKMMRLGVVHEHARKKVESIKASRRSSHRDFALFDSEAHSDVDEICVYLSFEIELHDRLQLPVSAQEMLFPNFIRISKEELDAAEKEALRISEKELNRWLELWPEWQRYKRTTAVESLKWEDLPMAKIPKRVSLSLTTFIGDPMTQPVMLGKSGPWNFDELIERYVEHGLDFNNVSWSVDEFLDNLGRLEPPQLNGKRVGSRK